MKKAVLIFVLFILFQNISFGQKLSERYNVLLDRKEYYNSKNQLVYYALTTKYKQGLTYFKANGEMIEKPNAMEDKKVPPKRKNNRFMILGFGSFIYEYDDNGRMIDIKKDFNYENPMDGI